MRRAFRRVAWPRFFSRNRHVWMVVLLLIASIAAALVIYGRPPRAPEVVRPPEVYEESAAPETIATFHPSRGDAQTEYPGPSSPADLEAVRESEETPQVAALPEPTMPYAVPRGRVGIVIDDLGWTQGIVEQLRYIDPAINLAILPFAPYAKETAEDAHEAGMEVLVHIPMEPHEQAEAEDGMLRSSMSPAEVSSHLRQMVEAVPYAVGANNHMGSKLTEDAAAMAVVVSGLQQAGFFFLDSCTSPNSIAYKMARTLDMPAARRDVFLDTDLSLDAIVSQMMQLGEIAKREGFAIGIGHPNPVTLEALRRCVPRLRQEGLEIVPVSRLVQ